jgi:tetratricopeptide (TPR) repeat protein
MAFVLSQEGDFDGALAEADTAAALAPYDAFMLGTLANVATMAGKPERAIDWIKSTVSRDPQNQQRNNYRLGWAYYAAGDYEQSIAAMKNGPAWVDVPIFLASSYVRLGRLEDARAEIKRALAIEPTFTQAKLREGYFYRDPTILERQLADLGKAGLPEK